MQIGSIALCCAVQGLVNSKLASGTATRVRHVLYAQSRHILQEGNEGYLSSSPSFRIGCVLNIGGKKNFNTSNEEEYGRSHDTKKLRVIMSEALNDLF